MANFYQNTPNMAPAYLVSFKWETLLESIFSSASYLQFYQDEPAMAPSWNANTKMCEWPGPDTRGYFPGEWIRSLETTCQYYRDKHDDVAQWNW